MKSRREERRLVWERRMDWPLTVLAVAYLAGYAVIVLNPGLSAGQSDLVQAIMDGSWAVFAVDYVVRLGLTTNRLTFIRQNLLDLLIIVLPLLRPLRLLRLVTVLNVLNRQVRLGYRGKVVTYVGGSVVLLTFAASLAVLDAERHNPDANITSFGDALWWSLATMTTVGYGDRYPITTEGRLVAVGLMVAGIALLGVVTATVASWFVERIERVETSETRTQDRLAELLEEVRTLRTRLDTLEQPPAGSVVPAGRSPASRFDPDRQ